MSFPAPHINFFGLHDFIQGGCKHKLLLKFQHKIQTSIFKAEDLIQAVPFPQPALSE